MTRTKIKQLANNRCQIITSDGETTDYWAPANGGYVYDESGQPGTLGKQVCDKLYGMGNTLHWRGTYPLIDLIRQEYQAAYRQERRDNKWT